MGGNAGRAIRRRVIAEAARSIASSAAVQAQLIDDLLDVSRIMTHKSRTTEDEAGLREVVETSISGMRPNGKPGTHLVEKECGDSPS